MQWIGSPSIEFSVGTLQAGSFLHQKENGFRETRQSLSPLCCSPNPCECNWNTVPWKIRGEQMGVKYHKTRTTNIKVEVKHKTYAFLAGVDMMDVFFTDDALHTILDAR
jgi:hypothetical protein